MRRTFVILLLSAALAGGWLATTEPALATVTTLGVPQLTQHRDNDYIFCSVPAPPWCPGYGPHPPACAAGGCVHCAAYCAPASVMMLRGYRGYGGCPCTQDCLYNRNKHLDGELPDDFIFQTHGIGMQDPEVFQAFLDALGEIHLFSSGVVGDPWIPLSPWVLRQLLCMDVPLLWLDRDGYPPDMPPEVRYEMMLRGEGHAKVIAGYDDRDTYCLTDDDLVLVLDPWPSAVSPSWAPIADVIASDPLDLFAGDRLPGTIVAESFEQEATAWNGGRRMVRDESDGSYNVVYHSGGHIYFTKARHPHETPSWTNPIQIDSALEFHIAREPAIAIGRNPNGYSPLHVVWSESAPAPDSPAEVIHSFSLDGGRSWSPPMRVHASPFEDSRHPSIDVDGRGNPHAIWDETGLEMGREIFYSMFPMDAGGWTLAENISRTPMLDSSFPSLAMSYDFTEWDDPPIPARSVHVAWVETHTEGAVSTVVYRYWDLPDGWFPPLGAPPEDVTGGIGGTSPSIVAGPDRIAKLVWTSSQEHPGAIPATVSDVYYNERAGGAWGVPQLVSFPDQPRPAASICPTLAIANGPYCVCLHATWEQWNIAEAAGDVWVAMRSGMTMQWGARTPVTYDHHGARRFPSLAYKNGTDFTKGFDLVWTDPNWHFEYYVRFLGTSVGNPGAASADGIAPAARDAIAASPNPFRGAIRLSGPESIGGTLLRVHDIRGRLVRELADRGGSTWIWDGSGQDGRRVPQGIYFVRSKEQSLGARRIVCLR